MVKAIILGELQSVDESHHLMRLSRQEPPHPIPQSCAFLWLISYALVQSLAHSDVDSKIWNGMLEG